MAKKQKKNSENMSLEKSELIKRYGNEMVEVVDASIVSPALRDGWTSVDDAHLITKDISKKRILKTPLITTLNIARRDEYRYNAELDPSIKQVIPYTLVRHEGRYWVTHRLGKTGEQRLIGAYSLGTGGHMAPGETVKEAMLRELEEEVGITMTDYIGFDILGYINSNASDVNSVHLGVVIDFPVRRDDIECLEKEKLEGEWMTVEEIATLYKNVNLESWSAIVYENVLE